jgi:pimeloyl-ACP methyl ester carboxylesterase
MGALDELVLDPQAVPFPLLADGSLARPDPSVTDVVFVVHGIRDKGFWTKKIARAIRREAAAAPASGKPRKVQSMTMSYGYLPMLPFIFPTVRRGKTAWLMDRYVEARALYPEAVFHYVGHSNGTYLAARALTDYPAVRFERIVFGGSVVRSDFDWRAHVRAGRLRSILNYVATNDWVVAIFPSGLRALDLGAGGHAGFGQLGTPGRAGKPDITVAQLGSDPSYQLNYIRGNHGAAIRESQWDEIAGFIVGGVRPSLDTTDYQGRQSWLVKTFGLLPPLWLLLFVAASLGLYVFAGLHLGVLAWIVGAILLATILWLV